MLDATTRRRIDTARDILVGKVPDPKSQVEQITIALIYKFMDDMDAQAEEFGGERTFFADEFARYGWAQLMRGDLGGHDMRDRYVEAIERMPQNPGIPELFRQIFRNTYLPYRDPETLRAFLKEIDGFEYDHSERLGDAFEYLLQVLGSQGDAGQFRTPRHIIDFIVEIVNPEKDDVILDPACGTAGFLISAYKHIRQQNSSNPEAEVPDGQLLSITDRQRLAENIQGYDISPDMVRLSLVNMYLHHFPDPKIYEYDTLTSEERWDEYADVILANPPFMSPKGGIRPHKRFSVQSKRSEVLFVDYIYEHLTPNGRAGIIVPEGVIFQSQTAYKKLRKLLVDEALIAVISLPAGVFNPYSGVKTSILILDKSLAKRSSTVGFFKVNHDGFSLGSQRREGGPNDLPQVLAEITAYRDALAAGEPVDELELTQGLIVEKELLAKNGDYNLSGERYRVDSRTSLSKWMSIPMGEFCDFATGGTPKSAIPEYYEDGTIPWLVSGDIHQEIIVNASRRITELGVANSNARILPFNSVMIALNGQGKTRGTVALLQMHNATCNQSLVSIAPDSNRCLPEYLFRVLRASYQQLRALTGDQQRSGLNIPLLKGFEVPLPPLEVQREIVAEIEGYQRVIDGARAVVENYRPQIAINPSWPVVELGDVIDSLETGVSVNSENRQIRNGEFGILKTSAVTSGAFLPLEHKAIIPAELDRARTSPKKDSIIISRMNTEALVGASAYIDRNFSNLYLPDRLWQTVITRKDVSTRFVHTIMASEDFRGRLSSVSGGTSGSMKNISKPALLALTIPLPPLETQQAIVEEIEAEQRIVDGNRQLIERMQAKIDAVIARVWGEPADEATPVEPAPELVHQR